MKQFLSQASVRTAGSQAASGQTGNWRSYPLYRFPKWLAQESYTITHQAGQPGRFTVTLVRGEKRLVGFGATITEAAKQAAEKQFRPCRAA